MATNLTGQAGNIKDLLSGIGVDGNYLVIGEILERDTTFFRDAPMVEANNFTYHEYEVRNSLPTSSIVRGNQRRVADKSSKRMETVQLEQRAITYRVDVNVLEKSPSAQEHLNNEMSAAVQGIAQDFDTQMLYGSGITDEMKGLSNFMTTPNAAAIPAGPFVIDAGATSGDLTSMYIVAWDSATGCCMAYPKGSNAGIKTADKGIVKSWTDDGYIEYATQEVTIGGGLVVKDQRAIGRIGSIDVSSPSSTTFDENDLILIINMFPAHLRNKVMAYASRRLKASIDMRANDKDNAYYTAMDVFGNRVNSVSGVPIMLDEMISEDEDAI